MVRQGCGHQQSGVTQVAKTKISTLKFQYHDDEKDKEEQRRAKRKLRELNNSECDYEETQKEEKIDFKQPVVNEIPEVIMKLNPTYGVVFDKIPLNDNKAKTSKAWNKRPYSKVHGKKYSEIPSLKTTLTRTQYKEMRRANNLSVKINDNTQIFSPEVRTERDMSNSRYVQDKKLDNSQQEHVKVSDETEDIKPGLDKLEIGRGFSSILPDVDNRSYKAAKILVDNAFTNKMNPANTTSKSFFSEQLYPNKEAVARKFTGYNLFRRMKIRRHSRTSHSRNNSKTIEDLKEVRSLEKAPKHQNLFTFLNTKNTGFGENFRSSNFNTKRFKNRSIHDVDRMSETENSRYARIRKEPNKVLRTHSRSN